MDNNPFDEKDRDANSAGDNTPISIPDSQEYPQVQPEGETKSDRTLWFTIGGITLTACCVAFLVVYTFFKNNPISLDPFSQSFPTPRPTAVRNLTATQSAWVKPAQSPTLGSAEEVERAIEDKDIFYLEGYAFDRPYSFPEINQPGDIYIYEINVTRALNVLWDYGWCTTTTKILDENFAQMKIEFLVNGTPVSKDHLAITEYQREDDGYCRSYTALVTDWPPGQHQLETRITFLQPTDDGWNLYPAGMHMFKYFIYVE